MPSNPFWVNSLMAEAPFDLEYIVVDGGSTDGTLDLSSLTASALRRSYPSPTAGSTMP